MQLTKPIIAGGAATLLTVGALVGSVFLGSAFAAGPTNPTPVPTVVSSAKPAAAVDTEARSNAPDTDNVQSGGQSGSQIEDKTPDTASEAKDAPEVKGAAEAPESATGAEKPEAAGG